MSLFEYFGIPEWIHTIWVFYFWVAATFTLWFCLRRVGPGANGPASDFVGSVMVAFVFGWLVWPLLLWRVIRGRPIPGPEFIKKWASGARTREYYRLLF